MMDSEETASDFERTSLEVSQVDSFDTTLTMCTIRQDDQRVFQAGAACELRDSAAIQVGAHLNFFTADDSSFDVVYLLPDDVKRLGEALLTLHAELGEHEQTIKGACEQTSRRLAQEEAD